MKKNILACLIGLGVLAAGCALLPLDLALAQPVAEPQSAFSDDLSGRITARRSALGVFAGFSDFNLISFIQLIVITLISLLATIFLCLIVYGGYIWMMARGNEEEVRRAKGIIRQSIIGLIIVFGSYAIGYFILFYLLTGGAGNNPPAG